MNLAGSGKWLPSCCLLELSVGFVGEFLEMDRFVGSSGLWHSKVVGDSNIGTAIAGCRPLRQPPQCWVIRQERSRCWNWLSRRSSMWRCYEAADQSRREEWGDHRRLLQDLWMWFCHRLVVCWYVYQCICPRREKQCSIGAVGYAR